MTLPLLTPDWPAPANVRAACSTRAGGVSTPPYDSLNLGDHVGDQASAVAQNRSRFAEALGARPVYMKQVHGWDVLAVDAQTPDGTQADACITQQRGVACTIMVADCLPVLLTDLRGRAVGAAHCGWRGLAGAGGSGAIEALWARLRPLLGEDDSQGAAQALAWLGPCIGPTAFEVGPEVRAAFTDADPQAAHLFRPHGESMFLADLPGLARRRLRALGIDAVYGNDGSAQWCTVSNASRFFSHRRDRTSGRFAAAIWLA